MPLYEYLCEACGHRFEKIQKFSDVLESVCPACGGVVRKLMSSPAIQFKGTGFYITDYVRKDQGDSKSGDAGSETGSDSGKTDKTDKSDKTEKSDKTDRADRSDKAEKAEKAEKADKAEKKEARTEKPAAVEKPAPAKPD